MGIAAALAVGAVASVGSGLIASSGAKKAANAQVEASNTAAAQQQAMFDKQVSLQEPFRQAGLSAQDRYFELMGMKNPNAAPAPTGPEAYGLTAVNVPNYGGYGGYDGFSGYGGATSYVDAQGNPVTDVNAYMAANPLTAAAPSADFGKYSKDFGMSDFTADPGYQFRLDEGQKALERSASARGMLASGSTLKGITNYAQGAASQEYTNAFNRYQVNRSNQLNPLENLMGSGQSATNTLTAAAGQQGQNQAETTMAAGQARASGYVGSANALSGALGSIGNAAINYPSMNAMTNYYNRGGGYGGRGFGGRKAAEGEFPNYPAYAGVRG